MTKIGFKPKEFHEIKQEMETKLKSQVDPYLHFAPGSVAGMLTSIVANQATQAWEALAGLYHSLRPDSASGRALDSLCSLTGTYRKKASYSRAKAKMTLDAHTSLPAGARIKTSSGDFFKTTAHIKNNSNTKSEIEADLTAEETGPKLAQANSVAQKMIPTTGWSQAMIIKSYKLGRDDETDQELRLRRIVELKASGAATLDSMRSRLLQLDGVDAVHIREDKHSFEAIIKGGKNEKIAKTIWSCKPLGVRSTGQIQQKIVLQDWLEKEQIIRFSRPKLIQLYLHAKIKLRQKLDDDGLKAIKNSLVNFAERHFKLGGEIYPSRFFETILSHDEVLDILSLKFYERSSKKPAPEQIAEDEIPCLRSLKDIHIEQLTDE